MFVPSVDTNLGWFACYPLVMLLTSLKDWNLRSRKPRAVVRCIQVHRRSHWHNAEHVELQECVRRVVVQANVLHVDAALDGRELVDIADVL